MSQNCFCDLHPIFFYDGTQNKFRNLKQELYANKKGFFIIDETVIYYIWVRDVTSSYTLIFGNLINEKHRDMSFYTNMDENIGFSYVFYMKIIKSDNL